MTHSYLQPWYVAWYACRYVPCILVCEFQDVVRGNFDACDREFMVRSGSEKLDPERHITISTTGPNARGEMGKWWGSTKSGKRWRQKRGEEMGEDKVVKQTAPLALIADPHPQIHASPQMSPPRTTSKECPSKETGYTHFWKAVWHATLSRDALEGGGAPPPPGRVPSLCPATVPLMPSASFNGICN